MGEHRVEGTIANNLQSCNQFTIQNNKIQEILQNVEGDYCTFTISASSNNSSIGNYSQKELRLLMPCEINTITPNDYDLLSTYTTTEEAPSLPQYSTSYDFEFRMRVHRASKQDGKIIISGASINDNEAFVEYQFLEGISRFDISLSLFRNRYLEGIYGENCDFVIEEFRGRKYTTVLNLMEHLTNISSNPNNLTKFSIFFDKPTFRIRIRIKRNIYLNEDLNLARVVIGNVTTYKSNIYSMPLNGWELDYIDNYWNNSHVCPSHNCYTYAINYFPNTIQIGDVTKVYYDKWSKCLYSNMKIFLYSNRN